MTEKNLSGAELKELRDDVLGTKPLPEKEIKKLTTDGRQYSLKFPKRFIEEAEIDINKDVFEIILELPDNPQSEEKPKLSAILIRK